MFYYKVLVFQTNADESKKSQHGWVKWALREHFTLPCCDFASGGLEDPHQTNAWVILMSPNLNFLKLVIQDSTHFNLSYICLE